MTVELDDNEIARFWSKVEKSDACWPWQGPIDLGYGRFDLIAPRRRVAAHRISWVLNAGRQIPDGLTVEHQCHTDDPSCHEGVRCSHRACVRPDHLRLLTMRANVLASHDAPTAINARKTHCIWGHEFNAENTSWYDGKRGCKACRRRRDLARYYARKEAS